LEAAQYGEDHLAAGGLVDVRQGQQFAALGEARQVPVHAEHLDAAVGLAKGLQALEAGAGVVQYMGPGVKVQAVARHDVGAAPAAAVKPGNGHFWHENGAERGHTGAPQLVWVGVWTGPLPTLRRRCRVSRGSNCNHLPVKLEWRRVFRPRAGVLTACRYILARWAPIDAPIFGADRQRWWDCGSRRTAR